MASKETELVLYVKLQNPNFKGNDKHEIWRQYETKYVDGTRTRLRVYEKKNDENKDNMQVLTLKLDADSKSGIESSMEYNSSVTKDFSNGFIKIADSEQYKRRDTFKSNKVTLKLKRGEEVETHTAPDLNIEVDRFFEADGFNEWCKIDIEIDTLLKWIKSDYGLDKVNSYCIELDEILPCKALRIINSKTKDEESMRLINHLWDNVFKKPINS